MKKTVAVVALALGLLGGRAPAAHAADIQRFALIAGANFGGQARQRLKYAVSDAQRFNRVLHELGGLEAANVVLLEQPSLKQLQEGLEAIGRRVAAVEADPGGGRPRTEVVVYYSGHADQAGLLLGDDRYSYRTLRETLDGMGADVRIAVLDACASGAITRLKGGQARPPFMVDASSRMQGHAFLTSSAADEAAQESDRIGASYFTYYLIGGLRGAADASGEGTVTLDEAYRYAFRETLGRTAGTRAGAQHPSYDIALAGSGDVVMTDLRSTSAGLVLGEDLSGRCYVRDGDQRLVLELQKVRQRRVELGLAPGKYELRCQDGDHAFVAHPVLQQGVHTVLNGIDFTRAKSEPAVARGDAAPGPFAGHSRVEFGLGRNPLDTTSTTLSFLHWIRPNLAVGVRGERRSFTSFYSFDDSSYEFSRRTTGFLAELRLDLRDRHSASAARPYFFAGAGPAFVSKKLITIPIILGPEDGARQSVTQRDHARVFGAEGGFGLDATLGRRLTLGVHGGVRSVGGEWGLEYGVGLGLRLGGGGRPRP